MRMMKLLRLNHLMWNHFRFQINYCEELLQMARLPRGFSILQTLRLSNTLRRGLLVYRSCREVIFPSRAGFPARTLSWVRSDSPPRCPEPPKWISLASTQTICRVSFRFHMNTPGWGEKAPCSWHRVPASRVRILFRAKKEVEILQCNIAIQYCNNIAMQYCSNIAK